MTTDRPDDPNMVAGMDGSYHDLSTREGQKTFMGSFDEDGDGTLDRTEFRAAMRVIDPGITNRRADRLMTIYGTTRDNRTFSVPVGAQAEERNPIWAGTGTAQMFADDVLESGPAGRGSIDLARVGDDTLAHAVVRHAAVARFVKEGRSGSRTLTRWIETYQSQGLTEAELASSVGAVTGDTKPLSAKGRRNAKQIVDDFGRVGTGSESRVNLQGLQQVFGRNAIVTSGDGGTFVDIGVRPGPVSSSTVIAYGGSDTVKGQGSAYAVSGRYYELKLPSATFEDSALPFGVYPAPYVQRRNETFFVGSKAGNFTLSPDTMVRTENDDGTVTWTLPHEGGSRQARRDGTFSITVQAGGKKDRYLQDYQAFGTSSRANSSNANLEQAAVATTALGSRVEVLVPREHQFDTNPDGSAASAYVTPLFRVDGQMGPVEAVTPMMLPGRQVVYQVRMEDGTVVTVKPKGPQEKLAFQNLNAQINGGNGKRVPTSEMGLERAARVIATMPPEQATDVLDTMPWSDVQTIAALISGVEDGSAPGPIVRAIYDHYGLEEGETLPEGEPVTRADVGLTDDDTVHLDIGGEGRGTNFGITSGSSDAVNMQATQSTHSQNGRPIPNLVLTGTWEAYPFADGFADRISMEGAPLTEENTDEIIRLINPDGGRITLWIQDTPQHRRNVQRIARETGGVAVIRPDPDSGFMRVQIIIPEKTGRRRTEDMTGSS